MDIAHLPSDQGAWCTSDIIRTFQNLMQLPSSDVTLALVHPPAWCSAVQMAFLSDKHALTDLYTLYTIQAEPILSAY